MKDAYYIQMQARRIRKCLYPRDLPKGAVCPEYLRGLSEGRFWKAVDELRDIFEDFYARAEKDPASLNLPLMEAEKHRATSNEARSGNAALLHFPAALLSVAASADYKDGSLNADVAAVKTLFSELKRKYLPEQLHLLSEYGFVPEGFDGKRLPKSGTLALSYPDNPDMIVILAAWGDKFSRYTQSESLIGLDLMEQFIFLTPRVFADNTEKLPPKTVEHMAAAVGSSNGDMLIQIAKTFAERGMTLHFGTAFLKNRFFNPKGKDTLTHIEYGDYKSIHPCSNEKTVLRLKLNHPDAYIDKVKSLPPSLYRSFIEIWCAECAEKCNRRIVYHLDGQEKRACGCFFFAYEVRNKEELESLMELYDLEQSARAKKA